MEMKININEKLFKLYNECIDELKAIRIDLSSTGKIDIKLTNRSKKRYGCCKQEKPDPSYCRKVRRGRKVIIKCDKFDVHHIEISTWVMDLNDDIIKNTIMHELIHCMPYCNNHGKVFKAYSTIINEKLGYNISRVGNKEQDFKASNLEYEEKVPNYKYEIVCTSCGQKFYRQRINKDFCRKYRCGVCGGKLQKI